jgi:hypothetical protein
MGSLCVVPHLHSVSHIMFLLGIVPLSEDSRALQSVAHQIFWNHSVFEFHFRNFCNGCSLNSYFSFFVHVCSNEVLYYLPSEYLPYLHLFTTAFPSCLRAGYRKVSVRCYGTLLLTQNFSWTVRWRS